VKHSTPVHDPERLLIALSDFYLLADGSSPPTDVRILVGETAANTTIAVVLVKSLLQHLDANSAHVHIISEVDLRN
jgi:hypothetical protein